jgi:hypothetical protein
MPITVAEFHDGDATILVETAEGVQQSSRGMGAAGIGDRAKTYIVKQADETFTHVMSIISYSSNTLLAEINKIHERPETVEIEFGVKVTGEGKAMLASGKIEANYTVKLSWNKSK